MSDELDLLEAPESARPSDPGGEVLALRFMVNELGREPAPALDWDRVEVRLLARIEAGEADEAPEAPEAPDADVGVLATREPLASGARVAESRLTESLGRSSKPSSTASAARGSADVASLEKAGRSGSGERTRTRRGSSKVRARSVGLWAAATLVLVSAAAFAWFERGGALGERAPDGSSQSQQPMNGSTGASRAGGSPVDGRSADGDSKVGATAESASVAEASRSESHGSRARFGAAARVRSTLVANASAEPSPTSSARRGGVSPSLEVDAGAEGRSKEPAHGSEGSAAQVSAEAMGSISDAELASRVRSCLSARTPHLSSLDEGLERRIESSLSVRIEPDGTVGSVSFQPPLRPELQSCALFVLSLRLGGGPRELRVPIRLQ